MLACPIPERLRDEHPAELVNARDAQLAAMRVAPNDRFRVRDPFRSSRNGSLPTSTSWRLVPRPTLAEHIIVEHGVAVIAE